MKALTDNHAATMTALNELIQRTEQAWHRGELWRVGKLAYSSPLFLPTLLSSTSGLLAGLTTGPPHYCRMSRRATGR